MSEAAKGYKHPSWRIQQNSLAQKKAWEEGKYTEERNRKISKTLACVERTEEFKRNTSKGVKRWWAKRKFHEAMENFSSKEICFS